jgi:exopolysaccharide production protein ExoY
VAPLTREYSPRRGASWPSSRDAGAARLWVLGLVLVWVDVIVIGVAVAVAVPATLAVGQAWVVLLAAVVAGVVVGGRAGLHRRCARRVMVSAVDELGASVLAGVAVAGAVAVAAPAVSPGAVPAWRLVIVVAVLAAGIPGLRWVSRRVLVRRVGPDRVLLVGDGEAAAGAAQALERDPRYCLPLGIVAEAGFDARMAAREADLVVVATEYPDAATLAGLARRCHRVGLFVAYAVRRRRRLDAPAQPVLLALGRRRGDAWTDRAERVFDVGVSVVLLLALLPVMALIAAAIRLSSGGMVLFCQRRIGRRGRPFCMRKFRTMVPDAEAMSAALAARSRSAHWLHLERDPRVTRLGRLLRMTSWDELPQLWHVLIGEMSLVGPRPLSEADAAQVPDWARARYDVRPGITGPWQALGRTSIEFEDMLRLDTAYTAVRSPSRDAALLVRTLPAVLLATGAN